MPKARFKRPTMLLHLNTGGILGTVIVLEKGEEVQVTATPEDRPDRKPPVFTLTYRDQLLMDWLAEDFPSSWEILEEG